MSAPMIHLRSYASELTAQKCLLRGGEISTEGKTRYPERNLWLLELFSSPREAQNSQPSSSIDFLSIKSTLPRRCHPTSRRVHTKRLLRSSRCPGSRRSDEWFSGSFPITGFTSLMITVALGLTPLILLPLLVRWQTW